MNLELVGREHQTRPPKLPTRGRLGDIIWFHDYVTEASPRIVHQFPWTVTTPAGVPVSRTTQESGCVRSASTCPACPGQPGSTGEAGSTAEG
jgi:hypothetical protein